MDLDRVPDHALISCVDQPMAIFTDIFKLSILQAEIPTSVKKPSSQYQRKHVKHALMTTTQWLHCVMVKNAQQCRFFLRQLSKFRMSIRTITNLYRCTIGSMLSGCIKAWCSNCSAQDHKKLRKVVYTAQNIMEANLPSIDSIYTPYCRGKTANIIKDPSHP
eukprot:g27335.t1